jgi:predicted nucleic acid-binding protein
VKISMGAAPSNPATASAAPSPASGSSLIFCSRYALGARVLLIRFRGAVMRTKYMLDTTVFNKVKKILIADLSCVTVLATGIQEAELGATKKPEGRREELLDVFKQVNPATSIVASFAWGIEGAGWGQAHWNDGTGTFQKMRARLRELDGAKKTRKKPLGQERDILIAETAMKRGATFVTDDPNLRRVVSEFGGRVIDTPAFLSEAEKSREL